MVQQFEPKTNLPSGGAGATGSGSLTTLIDEIVKNGVPHASERGRRKFTITDGPFAETKELIAGAVC